MRRNYFNIALLLFVTIIASCQSGTTTSSDTGTELAAITDPGDYNDKLINLHETVWSSLDTLMNAFEKPEAEIQKAYGAAVKDAGKAVDDIKKMPPFKENDPFYNAALSFLTLHKQLMENDWKSLSDAMGKKDPSEAESEQMETMVNSIMAKYEASEKEFENAQKAFASEHGLILIE